MDKTPIFKITDYIERDLKWEEKECNSIGIDFNYYQLKEGSTRGSGALRIYIPCTE